MQQCYAWDTGTGIIKVACLLCVTQELFACDMFLDVIIEEEPALFLANVFKCWLQRTVLLASLHGPKTMTSMPQGYKPGK